MFLLWVVFIVGKAFTVHSVHHFRSVYCGGVRSVYCVWCLLWEKCLLCTVFIMLQVITVCGVRSVYCGGCLLWEKCLLCTVFIMLQVITVGGVRSVDCGWCLL